MGCGHSQGGGTSGNTSDPRRIIQQKIPILLFCLPGSGRDAMLRIVNSDIMKQGDGVNVRFIDILNQRSVRRYWIKDLQARKDYAAIFYLADVRDHPTLLLTARTLNWFLRSCPKTFEIKLLVVYTEKKQLTEFTGYLPEGTEILALCETNDESIEEYMRLLQGIEKRFAEQKRNTTVSKSII
jgi:hypothetical protein